MKTEYAMGRKWEIEEKPDDLIETLKTITLAGAGIIKRCDYCGSDHGCNCGKYLKANYNF